MQKTVSQRFLEYVRIHTASSDRSTDVPTTPWQFDLARLLGEELRQLGAADVTVDEHCYVYAVLPATPGCEKAPRLGFIAHMDTIPDYPGKNVNPQVIENYDGGDVALADGVHVLSAEKFPHLKNLAGRTLITTDGTTVLGADDKAGVAEIMTLVDILQSEKQPHGKICIGFTPDEEVGSGADHFDVARFGADFAYTVDGGEAGEVEYENFNAAAAVVQFKGYSVHPGGSKNLMVNAALTAMEFNAMLPAGDTPRCTQDYEGFFHLIRMQGDVDSSVLEYIVRDHDAGNFTYRQQTLQHITNLINERYGEGTCTLTLREQYRNMAEKIAPCFHLIENAKLAASQAGAQPLVLPIRGGTDGARLSYMGLPCPNLGTGGYAGHGPYEHTTVEGLETATRILLNLTALYKDFSPEDAKK